MLKNPFASPFFLSVSAGIQFGQEALNVGLARVVSRCNAHYSDICTIATEPERQITLKKNSIPPGVYYFEADGKKGAVQATKRCISKFRQ